MTSHLPARRQQLLRRGRRQRPPIWYGGAQGIFGCRRRRRERAIRTSVTVGSHGRIWHRRPRDPSPTDGFNIRNNRNIVAVVWIVSAPPHSIGAIERRFDSPSPCVFRCPTRIGSVTDSVHALHGRCGKNDKIVRSAPSLLRRRHSCLWFLQLWWETVDQNQAVRLHQSNSKMDDMESR